MRILFSSVLLLTVLGLGMLADQLDFVNMNAASVEIVAEEDPDADSDETKCSSSISVDSVDNAVLSFSSPGLVTSATMRIELASISTIARYKLLHVYRI
jgi:hypothetical protein